MEEMSCGEVPDFQKGQDKSGCEASRLARKGALCSIHQLFRRKRRFFRQPKGHATTFGTPTMLLVV